MINPDQLWFFLKGLRQLTSKILSRQVTQRMHSGYPYLLCMNAIFSVVIFICSHNFRLLHLFVGIKNRVHSFYFIRLCFSNQFLMLKIKSDTYIHILAKCTTNLWDRNTQTSSVIQSSIYKKCTYLFVLDRRYQLRFYSDFDFYFIKNKKLRDKLELY